MSNIEFTWDGRKAQTNFRKHGISFEEAQSVFFDDGARLMDDPGHSQEEERFLILGFSFESRCLMVAHCYQEDELVIRLISARLATKNEEQTYWSFK